MMNHAVRTAAICLLVILCAAESAHTQAVGLTASGYVQNFDALAGSTGTVGTLVPWSDNGVIPGWYAYKNRVMTGSPAGSPVSYFIDDGTSSTGGDGLRSYGSLAAGQTNSPSDRALGELSSTDSTLIYSFGFRLANATGAPVTSLMIAYRGEQWRQNTGTKGLVFEYQIGASSLSAGTWTAVPSLNFLPLKTGSSGALDGNAPANSMLKSARVDLALGQGQELWLRWTKQGVTSCGLAVDDLMIQPAPAAQPTNLAFSGVTSTSMNVSFTASAPVTPSGYLVLCKGNSAPAALPVSGVTYAAGDTLGDAQVVSVGSSVSFQMRGLVPSSEYHYAVFAYAGAGAVINYLLDSPLRGSCAVPAAQASLASDIAAISGSESAAISSLVNDPPPLSPTSGVKAWSFTIRDGGAGGDADTKPTIVRSMTIRQGTDNSARDWRETILGADLFEGAVHIASGTITAEEIVFSQAALTIPDNGSATLTLRLSLARSGLTDHAALQFSLATLDVWTDGDTSSSQMNAAVSAIVSDHAQNRIDIIATKLIFSGQPSDCATGMIMSPAVVVEGVDANNNRDAEFASVVSLAAEGAALNGAPIMRQAQAGAAVFDSLSFSSAAETVTLTAAANGGAWHAASVAFRVAPHRTFFVDAEQGGDQLSGLSAAAAWKTLAKINQTVFEPGDSIVFKSGGVWTGQLKPKGSGTSVAPIVVGTYGGAAKPVINGAGVTGEGVVYLYNQKYWEITGLEITNDAAASGDRRGVLISASNAGTIDHIYLKNLFIHNIKGIPGDDNAAKRTAGIGFEVTGDALTPTRFNDIWIDSCTIAYIENIGLYTDNTVVRSDYPNTAGWTNRRYTNLRITRNVIHHINKNAMIIRLCQGGLVEHNVCFETALGTTGNTMFTTSCDGTVFQFNEGYLNRACLQGGDFGDGSMYDADLQSINCIFQYSYSHDNSHGLFWTCTTQQDTGNICRYNVSRNDKGIIFCINYPVTSVTVYNNTVYCGSSALSPTFIAERNVNAGTRAYSFYNNIIFNLSANAQPYLLRSTGYTRTVDHNLFYGFHPANEPADAHKLTVDPLFVDAQPSSTTGWVSALGFALAKNSPAIDQGVAIPGRPERDYQGDPVPGGAGVDCGAFEYQQTLSVPQSGSAAPSRFMLEQNFPNPFNPSTEIHYSIPRAAHVSLNIYNMLGQQVASLVNEYQEAGAHRVSFSAGGLSSGMYVYRLNAGGASESRRLVVEK